MIPATQIDKTLTNTIVEEKLSFSVKSLKYI